jgi:3-phytase
MSGRTTTILALLAGVLPVAAPAAAAIPAAAPAPVQTRFETEPFFDDPAGGDADADDPAIWVHPGDRSRSLVIGTLKNGGLVVFDLTGRTVQRIAAPAPPRPGDEAGRFNNVDLLRGFPLDGRRRDLAVVTDRGRDKLVFYRIDPSWGPAVPPLADLTAPDAPWVFSASQDEVNGQRTAYGLATTNGRDGAIGFVSRRERAQLARVSFVPAPDGRVTYRVRATIPLPTQFRLPDNRTWTPCLEEDGVQPQAEGMVIDEHARTLYTAQEPVGVWRMNLDGSGRTLVERVRTYGVPYDRTPDPEDPEEFACSYRPDPHPGFGGRHLSADAEGLTIYYVPTEPDERYLSASSQGDNTFSVWDIDEGQWEHEGTYAVAAGSATDSVEESDGSHIVSADLGPAYPLGLLVVHDGDNTPEVPDKNGGTRPNTNFKLIPADRLIAALDLDL